MFSCRSVASGVRRPGNVRVSAPRTAGRPECWMALRAGPFGELSLGLLDHHPAVQRALELLGDGPAAVHVALVQQPDGGRRSAAPSGQPPGTEQVISGDIYRSVVRQGYEGIDQRTFHPLIRVRVAGQRHPGWVQVPPQPPPVRLAELVSHRQPA